MFLVTRSIFLLIHPKIINGECLPRRLPMFIPMFGLNPTVTLKVVYLNSKTLS
ncbi:hypothetical protein RINTHH_6960 [Richelia intracellularis HH01]|uniref:Uncharacterized protein n=1 Tax=Richelia intracellularis HH01 TaxID=1165094 RepID=M1X4X5_9NOST|nr:hypothetical protein RINTHH_6960 [Richelia intracellularis HH01]